MSRRAWVGGLISVVLLGLLAWYVEPARILAAVADAHLGLLAAAVAVHCLHLLLRVQRFAGLVGEEGLASRASFDAVFVGWLANLTLPAKAGEFARPVLYGRWSERPVAAAVGAMVVERALDLLGLGVLFAGALLLGLPASLPSWVQTAAWTAAGLAGVVLLLLGLLGRFGDDHGLIGGFREGLVAVGGLRPLLAGGAWTLGIWGLEVLGALLTLRAVGSSPEGLLAACAVLVVATTLAVAAPAGPAGLGVEQWVSVLVLAAWGVSEAQAVAASFLLLLAAVVWIAPAGGLALLRQGTPGDLRNTNRTPGS